MERATRQRKDVGDVSDLVESISRIGLINPLIIQKDGVLRAGERRLNAVRQIGWTSVSVQFVEDLDEASLQLLELDENIRRKGLTWQEESDAVARYHEIRKSLAPAWTHDDTAEALGASRQFVQQRLAVVEELRKPESRVHHASKFSEAKNFVDRKNSRAAAAVLNKIDPAPEREFPVLLADFNLWQPTYAGPKFNFIHCDFPYGIGFSDSARQNSDRTSLGNEYDDSEYVYFKLLDTLYAAMNNVVAESAHLMFWFSMTHYMPTRDSLEDMGWKINPFPLVWHKSDNAGILPDPQRGPRRTYETAFFASRGDRKIVQAVANSFAHPTTKEVHPSEKPVGVLKHFFRMIVDEHTSIFDPTAGSANALRAVLPSTTRLGLERSPEFFTAAKGAFYERDETGLV